MRKLKEVLSLDALGLSQHQIARSSSISQSTVDQFLAAAQAAEVRWPLPADWDDAQVVQALFPQRPVPTVWRKHPEPDWARIHEELQTDDLTLHWSGRSRARTTPKATATASSAICTGDG